MCKLVGELPYYGQRRNYQRSYDAYCCSVTCMEEFMRCVILGDPLAGGTWGDAFVRLPGGDATIIVDGVWVTEWAKRRREEETHQA